jgi:hypothetical protein
VWGGKLAIVPLIYPLLGFPVIAEDFPKTAGAVGETQGKAGAPPPLPNLFTVRPLHDSSFTAASARDFFFPRI